MFGWRTNWNNTKRSLRDRSRFMEIWDRETRSDITCHFCPSVGEGNCLFWRLSVWWGQRLFQGSISTGPKIILKYSHTAPWQISNTGPSRLEASLFYGKINSKIDSEWLIALAGSHFPVPYLLCNTFVRWIYVLDFMDSENPFELFVPDTCASKSIINDYFHASVRHKVVGRVVIMVPLQHFSLLVPMLKCMWITQGVSCIVTKLLSPTE